MGYFFSEKHLFHQKTKLFILKCLPLFQNIKHKTMKFKVASGDLQKSLQTVSGVIGNSQSRPILDNFLFDLNENQLTITASDGETTLITSIEVSSNDKGKMAVPAKIFTDLVKSFSDQPLVFSVKQEDNSQLKILEIIDEIDNYSVALDKEDEYPSLPDFDSSMQVSLPAGIMSEALNNTIFATSNDSLRPVMTGVLFQFTEEGCNFVATDSHRLALYSRTDTHFQERLEFIMPKKALMIFKTILTNSDESVLIESNQSMTKFSFKEHTWICRLVDGKFPNYEAVIPRDNPNEMTINRTLLLSSIRRAAIFSSKSTNQVRFKLSGHVLHLLAEDKDYMNKATMQIPCEYSGEEINIGFNSKFITEMLSIMNAEDVVFKMSAANRPCIIEPIDGLDEGEKLLMLSMPVLG